MVTMSESTTSSSPTVPVVAIVLAAGFGTRFDPKNPKQLVSVDDRPVIAWSLEAFEDAPEVTDIVVVVNPTVYEAVEGVIDERGFAKVRALVPGGETRADSTVAALDFLDQSGIPHDAKVLIHDGVRPFVSPKIIGECVTVLDSVNAATVAVPSTDTILLATPDEGGDKTPKVRAVPDRAATFRAQTPQCFRFGTIRDAYNRAADDEGFRPTDDTRVIIDYLPDEPVAIVQGSDDNMKITVQGDIDVAETIAPRARRVRNLARKRIAQQMLADM